MWYLKSVDVLLSCPALVTCPEGWSSFHQKCIFLVEAPMTLENALQVCGNFPADPTDIMVPRLLEIENEIEQGLLEGYLHRHPTMPGIWLGARRASAEEFTWISEMPFEYANWQDGNPTDNLDRGCVQVQSEASASNKSTLETGKWIDVSCELGKEPDLIGTF